MDGDEAIGAARRLLRRRPGEVVPPFVAEAGMQAVLQAVGGLVALTALFTARGTGRVDRVVAAGEDLLEASTREATIEGQEAFREAVLALFTPAVVAVAVLGVGVVVVARGAVTAAKVHVARAALRPAGATEDGTGTETATDGGETPLTAAVEGAFADTWRFAGLTALRVAVLVGPALVALALGGWTVTPLVVLLGIGGLFVAYVGFLFVGEAVVVEDAGPLAAVRHSAGFLRRRPTRAALYVAVEVATYLALLVTVLVLSALGLSRGVDLLTLFLVFPFLGLVRMGLYLPETGAASPAVTETDVETRADGGPEPTGGGGGLVDDALRALREGMTALWRFVGGHAGLVGVALAVFVLGGVAGRVVGPGTAAPIAGDPSGAFGAFPVDVAVDIAVNNWQVGVAEGYGGVALGLPTVGVLLFNGLVIGVTSGLFEPVAFVALVAPHGVIEVPALAVGGAVGLHLGRETLRTVRGTASTAYLGQELRRALLILVGLAPVFAVAGVVEAFLTPAIAGLVLG